MPLTGRELAKLAVLKGWKEVRVRGSYQQFKKDSVPYILTISIHSNKVLGIGLELPRVVNMSELSVEDGFITLIQADPSPYLKSTKSIRKNVTVPEWLVRLADREHVNYSEVLTQALEKKLQL